MVKAFIFSIDAFVAFTLILIVLHSLIYFVTIPPSYYSALMQANYLARDALSSITIANASNVLGDSVLENITLLEYIMQNRNNAEIQTYIGTTIPNEYGYAFEFFDSKTHTWETIYNTKDQSLDLHNKEYHKLRASAYSMFFGYTDSNRNGFSNPFCYKTCNPNKNLFDCSTTLCDRSMIYKAGNATLGLVRLIVYR